MLTVLCRLGRHFVRGESIWNEGYYFGRCGGCGAHVVRRKTFGSWRLPPPGRAVVWKPMTVAQRQFSEAVGLCTPHSPDGVIAGSAAANQSMPAG